MKISKSLLKTIIVSLAAGSFNSCTQPVEEPKKTPGTEVRNSTVAPNLDSLKKAEPAKPKKYSPDYCPPCGRG